METPLIDPPQLETFIVFGHADYLDLLGDVIHDVPGHLERLRTAISAGNPGEIRAAAHSLRGMLSYFGCVALTTRLADFEHQTAIPPEQAAPIHAELSGLWEKTLAAIKEWEKTVPDFAP